MTKKIVKWVLIIYLAQALFGVVTGLIVGVFYYDEVTAILLTTTERIQ